MGILGLRAFGEPTRCSAPCGRPQAFKSSPARTHARASTPLNLAMLRPRDALIWALFAFSARSLDAGLPLHAGTVGDAKGRRRLHGKFLHITGEPLPPRRAPPR